MSYILPPLTRLPSSDCKPCPQITAGSLAATSAAEGDEASSQRHSGHSKPRHSARVIATESA